MGPAMYLKPLLYAIALPASFEVTFELLPVLVSFEVVLEMCF